jgi:hypothetical protein
VIVNRSGLEITELSGSVRHWRDEQKGLRGETGSMRVIVRGGGQEVREAHDVERKKQ